MPEVALLAWFHYVPNVSSSRCCVSTGSGWCFSCRGEDNDHLFSCALYCFRIRNQSRLVHRKNKTKKKQMFITHGAEGLINLFILHNGMHLHTDGIVLTRPMKITPLWPLNCLAGTSKHTWENLESKWHGKLCHFVSWSWTYSLLHSCSGF